MKKAKMFLVIGTLALVACIFIFGKQPKKQVAGFKERKGKIALTSEWINTKAAIEGLLKTIEINPDDMKAKLQLAQAYIQESRITGDHGYYDGAASDLLDEVIKNEPNNFDALCCKATVLLSQHHFTEALKIAETAKPLNPYSAFLYGIICDANVELGNYKEAVKHCDKMISIRPDIRSYARVSYLREIHGDYNGAIAAAKLAVASGYPGLEQTVWTRTILAHLYENCGQLDSAEIQYNISLNERPDYPFALAGLAKLKKKKGDFKEAINLLEKANKDIIEYSFNEELIDLYELVGNKSKSTITAEETIKMLSPEDNNDESVAGHGHYADKELAYIYLKIGDPKGALQHILKEQERRPENIDVNECLAWVYYNSNDYKNADKYITKALITGSKNPTLNYRAGLIKIKIGKTEEGKKLIKDALTLNPFIDNKLKNQLILN